MIDEIKKPEELRNVAANKFLVSDECTYENTPIAHKHNFLYGYDARDREIKNLRECVQQLSKPGVGDVEFDVWAGYRQTRDQVTELERKLKDKDQEIEDLKKEIGRLGNEIGAWELNLRSYEHEIIQIRTQLGEAKSVLKIIYPSLPSYLGQSETPENPCTRRRVDEVLYPAPSGPRKT
jgi:hypothetical protein